jgi:hypothetical protein
MKDYSYSIIIEFRYGQEEDAPFFALDEQFQERMEGPDAPGMYDGNEIAMDNFDGRYYFFSNEPQETLAHIDDLIAETPFLRGARIHIRHGHHENAYTEVEIVGPDGKRNAISRFDAEQLSHIPDWGDLGDRGYFSEEGEEWKDEIKNERAKKLYNKWREIDYLIEAIWDKWDLSKDGEKPKEEKKEKGDEDDMDEDWLPLSMIEWHRDEMHRNSLIIPPKISGAEAGDLYIIRMENAAIIRKAASDVYLDTHMLREGKVADEQDIELLRSEIEQFREYFKEWVAGFEKDEFSDEWGLFV